MNQEDEVSLQLGNIPTQWSLIRKAHQLSITGASAATARQTLAMRYAPAIRRFVQIVVRNPELADELSQDAMVRILKGDFAGADPERGRFRDLLKTAIRNMARNYWAKENRRSSADFDLNLISDEGNFAQQLDEKWTQHWRANLLAIVWEKLKAYQDEQPSSVAYTLLKLRSDFPNDSSTDLAARLSETTGREFKPDNTRQLLRRARIKFVNLLIAEIADGLDDPSPENLKDDLVSLQLFASVKDLLPPRWQT